MAAVGIRLLLDAPVRYEVKIEVTSAYDPLELSREDLERAEDNETQATLAVDTPRFGGIGRSVPSEALAGLAALVRDPAE